MIGEFLKAGGSTRRGQVVLATRFGIVRAAGQYERRINYLVQNAAAADFVLSASEVTELDALFPPGAMVGVRYLEAGMVGIE